MKKVLSVLLALCLLLGALPMLASATGTAGLRDTGDFGDELTWSLMTDGALTIGVKDFESSEPVSMPNLTSGAPWGKYSSDIRCAFIGDRIVNIGGNTFNGYTNLESVYLPKEISSCGHEPFSGCFNLKTLHYAGSETDANFIEFRNQFQLNGDCPNEVTYHYNCDKSDYFSQPPKPQIPFTDVKADDYYADAVVWAYQTAVTTGVGNGKFGPNNPCTREQIVTFLWNSAYNPEPGSIAGFKDMPKNETFRKAISWAAEEGITSGYAGNLFRPSKTCTRAEAMTFIWRAHNCPEPASTAGFTDLPGNSDFRKAISWAYENNILAGDGKGHCLPDKKCTRAEIVSFLYRAR